METLTRRIFLAAGGATAAAALTQVQRPQRAIAQTDELNLYSARHYNTDDELYAGFTRQTGIRVNLIEGDADALLERVLNEGQNSPADVYMTVDAGRLWRAQEAGILSPVSSPTLEANIPENVRHPDGLWFGFSKRARVIMYNKDRVNPADLSTYEDLADPKWRGRILVRTSTNIYNQSWIASILEANGRAATEEWARAFAANFARPPEGNDTAQIEAAAAGLGDIAIANTYYLARLGASEDPARRAIYDQMGVFFPNQDGRGTHVNISGAGVLRTAPNRAAAIAFLEYLSGRMAQAFFAQGNYEYPVLRGTAIDPLLADFGNFKEDSINVEVLGRRSAEAVQIADRAGWR
ncbi:MAG: Fe(3+) ABC transporter substrate-binding protein [Leptolyngbyaceae cyanobacterium T60_A2020_046]|nr:Fe(3+) ABC transporter substrate-binding protein [Leptolyngbyaceae cyanobacterium T60_A2020_046]